MGGQNADFDSLDLLLVDVNGICRGKRVERDHVGKALCEGILLPQSVYGGNVRGDTVDATNLGIRTGDQDFACLADRDTLRAMPWTESGAQCLMEMVDSSGQPFAASPRHCLQRMTQQAQSLGLWPVVAVELEFYLFRDGLDDTGMPRLLVNPVTGSADRSTQVYSMDDLETHRAFLETVRAYCSAQQVPASTAVAEYAPGQFEINLQHQPDPVAACDHAIYLKRIIRRAARKHGMNATFMAKPRRELSGSGLHVHMSLSDENGVNRLAADADELRSAIAGLQATMADAMLLWAPHANSYRRYQPDTYVPLSPSWGYNNRSVALRVPAGETSATRIEHRVAGADANPYLVVTAVLAGICKGIGERLEPDEPIDGDASRLVPPSLPTDWADAIRRFSNSQWVGEYLGQPLQDLLATIKQDELSQYQRQIPPLDVEWYLQTV